MGIFKSYTKGNFSLNFFRKVTLSVTFYSKSSLNIISSSGFSQVFRRAKTAFSASHTPPNTTNNFFRNCYSGASGGRLVASAPRPAARRGRHAARRGTPDPPNLTSSRGFPQVPERAETTFSISYTPTNTTGNNFKNYYSGAG
jgi:hypothetical protein